MTGCLDRGSIEPNADVRALTGVKFLPHGGESVVPAVTVQCCPREQPTGRAGQLWCLARSWSSLQRLRA
jgi:hypothetical protein